MTVQHATQCIRNLFFRNPEQSHGTQPHGTQPCNAQSHSCGRTFRAAQIFIVAVVSCVIACTECSSAEPTASVFAAQTQAAVNPAVVTQTTAEVSMRDGIVLMADVYQADVSKPQPVLLMRTPYNKQGARPTAERFAAAGYTVVVQDCRGCFQSPGDFVPYNSEGQDGYDTVEWVGRQSWCNGKIGMWGSSYVGATQWQAAAEHPPGLVTITPTATFSSFYRNLYLGGAVRLSLISRWASGKATRPADAVVASDWDRVLMHLPLSEIDREIGWPIPWLSGMLTHPRPDGYWKRLDLTTDITTLKMPIMHVVGVYDFFSRESVDNFVRMQQQAVHPEVRKQQQLVLGPWDHGTIGKAQVGERNFGPHAEWDATAENLRWFDRVLKGDSAELTEFRPAVRYFSMGDNVWKEADTWPPSGSVDSSFYLSSMGHANTLHGDGKLAAQAPTSDEPRDLFVADPSDPTPACPVTDKRKLNAADWAPVDQRSIEERSDVLVYSSEVLQEPLTFAGNPAVELFVSADTRDADWVVRLVDVTPEGPSYNLAVGILRGSFRDSELQPEPLEPGKVYRVTIGLGPVAASLPPGHRLRLDISGGYFPLFDRNPNTGEGPFSSRTVVAAESVYHTPRQPSRLLLPRNQ